MLLLLHAFTYIHSFTPPGLYAKMCILPILKQTFYISQTVCACSLLSQFHVLDYFWFSYFRAWSRGHRPRMSKITHRSAFARSCAISHTHCAKAPWSRRGSPSRRAWTPALCSVWSPSPVFCSNTMPQGRIASYTAHSVHGYLFLIHRLHIGPT